MVLVRQLSLDFRRPPKLVRSRKKVFGICHHPEDGRFYLEVKRRKLTGKRVVGVKSVKAAKATFCLDHLDQNESPVSLPSGSISPSAAVMMLAPQSCPLSYQLTYLNPRRPKSPAHALGTLYHQARRLFLGHSFNRIASFTARQVFEFADNYNSIRVLLAEFDKKKLFPKGITFTGEAQKSSIKNLLKRMLLFLWDNGRVLSKKQLAEKEAAEGSKIIYLGIEEPIPAMMTLSFLLKDLGLDLPVDLRVRGTPDLTLIRRRQGRLTAKIVDYKIVGVDKFGSNDYDTALQLRFYGLWLYQALKGLGIRPEAIELEAEVFQIFPKLALSQLRIPFDENVIHQTGLLLLEASKRLFEYRTSGSFPAHPEISLCRACDHARFCPFSATRVVERK